MDYQLWVIFVVSVGISWVLVNFFMGCWNVLRSIEENGLYHGSNWAFWLVVKVLSGLFEVVFIGVVGAPLALFIAFGWTPLDIAVLLQMIFIECDIDGFWSHIVGTSGNCGPKAVEATQDGFLGWKGLTGMFGWTP